MRAEAKTTAQQCYKRRLKPECTLLPHVSFPVCISGSKTVNEIHDQSEFVLVLEH